jgi:pyruvate/2-oxoglutarate dehydrogenase complex dihydrolipoamide dehydrogenase (E3) component
LTEEQAVEQYGDVDIYTSSFRPMRNTISGSPMRAFMKLVVDAGSDKVVGCHMVGDDSAEIMQVRVLGCACVRVEGVESGLVRRGPCEDPSS